MDATPARVIHRRGAILALAVLLLATVAVPRLTDNQASEAATVTFAVYLQPPSVPASDRLDVSLVGAALPGQDFVVVDGVTGLENALATEKPQSVWIHTDALDDVPSSLLRDQMKRGAVIVGINVTSGILAAKLGVEASRTPDWKPRGSSTFVIMAQAVSVRYTNAFGQQASRSTIVRANDIFDPSKPAGLVALVNGVIEEIRATYGRSQLRHADNGMSGRRANARRSRWGLTCVGQFSSPSSASCSRCLPYLWPWLSNDLIRFLGKLCMEMPRTVDTPSVVNTSLA